MAVDEEFEKSTPEDIKRYFKDGVDCDNISQIKRACDWAWEKFLERKWDTRFAAMIMIMMKDKDDPVSDFIGSCVAMLGVKISADKRINELLEQQTKGDS